MPSAVFIGAEGKWFRGKYELAIGASQTKTLRTMCSTKTTYFSPRNTCSKLHLAKHQLLLSIQVHHLVLLNFAVFWVA